MKKILLGTTAVIALSTMSVDAFAAEKIALKLGGFMRQYVAVSNHDEVAPTTNTSVTRAVNLQQFANSEVYFKGSTKLDNGLKVSTMVQLETSTRTIGTRSIDISALTVSSDQMGAFTIGSAPHAGDDFITRAPMATHLDWGDTNTLGAVARTAAANTAGYSDASTSDITGMGGKSQSLKYISPNFSGVQAFASYSVGEGTNTNLTAGNSITRNNKQDGYTFGVAFDGQVSGMGVVADLTRANFGPADITHVGVNVSSAGFTVGGGYSDFSDSAVSTTTLDSQDGKSWELGVSYETGPYTVSAAYMDASNKGLSTTAGDNKDKKWNLAATYDLGAGIALNGTYFHSSSDPEGTVVATQSKVSISGFVAGLEASF